MNGDNIVNRSEHTPWYEGSTLLNTLETIHIGSDHNHIDCRFPVQTVIRPKNDAYHDFRGYAGRIAGGVFKPGDDVVVLPSGLESKVKTIETYDGQLEEAFAPMSVTMTLEDEIDVSRGDMIVRTNNKPDVIQDVDAMVCWLHPEGPKPRMKYTVRQTSNEVKGIIKEVQYKLNINTLHRNEEDTDIKMNDIARIKMRVAKPLLADIYRKNRNTGSLIIVDDATNETVAAGMII